jgi:hypothetical protein
VLLTEISFLTSRKRQALYARIAGSEVVNTIFIWSAPQRAVLAVRSSARQLSISRPLLLADGERPEELRERRRDAADVRQQGSDYRLSLDGQATLAAASRGSKASFAPVQMAL